MYSLSALIFILFHCVPEGVVDLEEILVCLCLEIRITLHLFRVFLGIIDNLFLHLTEIFYLWIFLLLPRFRNLKLALKMILNHHVVASVFVIVAVQVHLVLRVLDGLLAFHRFAFVVLLHFDLLMKQFDVLLLASSTSKIIGRVLDFIQAFTWIDVQQDFESGQAISVLLLHSWLQLRSKQFI